MSSKYLTMLGTVLCLLLFGSLIRLATSDALLSLRFLMFMNPGEGWRYRQCCKGPGVFCISPCYHKFTICFDDEDGPSHNINQCPSEKTVVTQFHDNNLIIFGDRIGSRANPLVWSMHSWPGRVRLQIDLVDGDHRSDFHVDFLQTFLSLAPISGRSGILFTMKNKVQLAIDAELNCGHNYYGVSCDKHCIPRNDYMGHYTCNTQDGSKICLTGWIGSECTAKNGNCIGNKCRNGALCKDMINRYECICPAGFTGNLCEQDVNECHNHDNCDHGFCENQLGSYTCKCFRGYTGDTCGVNTNDCLPSPCHNGATCHDLVDGFLCSCPTGFTGQNCEHNINECLGGVCKHGGTCTDLGGGFACRCSAFWEGQTCEENVNECLSYPCKNGGTCENIHEGFHCVCPTEFIGKLCEADMNECELDNTCHNNSTCTNSFGSFTCVCMEGWTGLRCDVDINECELGHCNNLGTCVNTHGGFQCECPINWQGTRCQDDVNECAAPILPCRNNATCHNILGAFHCECAAGWTGPLCDVDINECLLVPDICKTIGNNADPDNFTDYHTVCINTKPGYHCTCQEGWTGPLCNEDINECIQSPDICIAEFISTSTENASNYHTFCVNSNPGYFCICQEGWTGEHCDEDIDECLEDPFLCSPLANSTDNNTLSAGSYHAACVNTYPGFLCTCSEGWTGENCDKDTGTTTLSLNSTVHYENDTVEIYDTTTQRTNGADYSYKVSVSEINTTEITREITLNADIGDVTTEVYSGNSNEKSTTNDTAVNMEETHNITRGKPDISIPFYLACTIEPNMEWTVNKGLKQMFLDSHLFDGQELTVSHRSQAETFKDGQTATSIYPTVAVNGKQLSDKEISFVLKKESHKIQDHLNCPLFLDAAQQKVAFSSAHLSSSTPVWFPVLMTACVCLVVAAFVVIIVRNRRGMKTWFLYKFQGEKPELPIMNPMYVPASGVQETEEDPDVKQFWAMHDDRINSAAEYDVSYGQQELTG